MTMDAEFATEASSHCPTCGAAPGQYDADGWDGEYCPDCGQPAIFDDPPGPDAGDFDRTRFERWLRSLAPVRRALALGVAILAAAVVLAALTTAAVALARGNTAVNPADGSHLATPVAPVAPSASAAAVTPSSSAATAAPSSSASARAAAQRSAAAASRAAEYAEAMKINNLLDASAATRNSVATALEDVSICNDISSAVVTIKAAAQRYYAVYVQAFYLNTGQLPTGAALKSSLVNAYYLSAVAYTDFLSWAQQRQAWGCADPAAAAYDDGMAAAAKAAQAKDEFVQSWNPVASSFGLRPRFGEDI